MKFMYTTEPDEHCHDFGDGTHGRPIFSGDQAHKKSLGWTFKQSDLVVDEKPDEGPTRDEIAESLGIALFDEDGKKRHYKLIQGDIDEHNESQAS